jgi:DNA-directed RNA polymerase specialized sigma24 family protein
LREIEQFSLEEAVAILRIPGAEVRARAHRATVALTRMRAPTALRSGSGMPDAFDGGCSQA